MAEQSQCPQCGTPLPAGILGGLCPKCLLQQTEAAGAKPDRPPIGSWAPPTTEEIAGHFAELEILGMIGRGGMGAVYKVRQKSLDRVAALKILPSRIADNLEFSIRFGREAQALARLGHPHIVMVFDSGQRQGLFYFLMEYVDGPNLRQLLDEGRMESKRALTIVPQICEALQYAHDQGIVHRDIKPENILIDRQGRVKIADFGIAKLVGWPRETSTLTQSGVMGTPHYMAPEQIEHPGQVDHRADIYSLGVVFYQMLTGELPIGRFDPPSRRIQVDVRLDEVVLRALEKEPQRRYQQADEVRTDVQTIAGSVPRMSSRSGVAGWKLRAFAVGVIILLAGAAAYLVWDTRKDQRSAGTPAQSQTTPSTTLFLFPPVIDESNGRVSVSGGDTRGPSIPFTWQWGDGNVSEGWFPQDHVYRDRTHDYVVTVMSHYAGGETAQAEVSVNFAHPSQVSALTQPPPLPADWRSIESLDSVNGTLYVGGIGTDGHGRFGTMDPSSGAFTNLSNLLPPSYAAVKAFAFGAGHLLVAADKFGQIFWGQLGDFNPVTGAFQDMTASMHAPFPYNWSINAIVFDGGNFLMAGAGQGTGLAWFSPRTQWFTPLAQQIPYYFATNSIVLCGNSSLLVGAGAYTAGTAAPPALGWINFNGAFRDLKPAVPAKIGAMFASAFNGRQVLIRGFNAGTGQQMLELFDPSTSAFSDVNNVISPFIVLHHLSAIGQRFILSGQSNGEAYLAVFDPVAKTATNFDDFHPADAVDITAVNVAGDQIALAGVDAKGQVFVDLPHSPLLRSVP